MKKSNLKRIVSLFMALMLFVGVLVTTPSVNAAGTIDIAKYASVNGTPSLGADKTTATYNGTVTFDLNIAEMMKPQEGNMQLVPNGYPWNATKTEIAYIDYTVNFPENVDFGEIKMESKSNTFPQTSMKVAKKTTNSVTFKLPLTDQNWQGIFNAYKADKAAPDSHKVKLTIPYTIKSSSKEEAAKFDGEKITGKGEFKFKMSWLVDTTTASSISLPLSTGLEAVYPEAEKFILPLGGDAGVENTGSLEVVDGTTWGKIKAEAEKTIDLYPDYEIVSWKLVKKDQSEVELTDDVVLKKDEAFAADVITNKKVVNPPAVPVPPVAKFEKQVDLMGDLELNSNTGHDTVTKVDKKDQLDFTGLVDVSPIKKQMADLEKMTAAPLDKIKVENLNVGFTAELHLPEGMKFTDNVTATPEGIKDSFEVESVQRVNDKVVAVTFKLKNINQIDNYKKLKDAVAAVDDVLKVTIKGAKFLDSAKANTDYTVNGFLKGDFAGLATNTISGQAIDFKFNWKAKQDTPKADSKYPNSENITYTVKFEEAAQPQPGQPEKYELNGTLDGDLLIGDNTQHDKVYEAKKTDKLKITGSLDVTPIKKELEKLEKMFPAGANNPMGIDVKKVDTEFVANIKLPEGLEFDVDAMEDTDAVLEGANGKFYIREFTVGSDYAEVILKVKGNTVTYADIQDAVKNVEDTLKVTIDKLKFTDNAKPNTEYKIVGELKGKFTAEATHRLSGRTINFVYNWKGIQKKGGEDSTALDSEKITFTLLYKETPTNPHKPNVTPNKPSTPAPKPNKEKEEKKTPKTGDDSTLVLYSASLAVVSLLIVALLLKKKSYN